MTQVRRLTVFLGVLALGSSCTGTGQGAEPQLGAVFPLGVSRVAPVEITLSGSDPKGIHRLFFSLPGMEAQRRGEGRFAVTVAGEAHEGEAEVWAVSPAGLTNPRRIAWSDLPQVVEQEKNDDATTAQRVELPVIVDAGINPATDRDEFQFAVEAGGRFSVVFQSESLGGTVRPALTVFAPDGRERAHSAGGPAEPAFEVHAHEGGTYRIRVEDRSYQRDPSSTYRLALFTGPRLVAAFPPVLTRGKTQALTLFGHQLPLGEAESRASTRGLERTAVTIDAPVSGDPDGGGWTLASAVMLDGVRYRQPRVRGALRIGLVDQEVTQETDQRHDTRATAQDVPLSHVVAGRFLAPGEVDWYRFSARKGQALWVEGVGERSGLLMDLDLAILDRGGNTLQAFTDTAQPQGAPAQVPLDTLDPMGVWTVPADGEYTLMIRDLYGPSLWGVERTYWLVLEPQHEAARVVIAPFETTPRGISLEPGGRSQLPLVAIRRGGHTAPITVGISDLPDGLQAEPVTIPAKQLTATLTIHAARDAPEWVGLLRFHAETRWTASSGPSPYSRRRWSAPGSRRS